MSERLDRIEAAIVALNEAIQADREQDRTRFEEYERRFEQNQVQFDNQMALNAELRTRLEIEQQNTTNLRLAGEALLQAIQIQAEEFRQHRSDGHGG